MAWFFSGVLRVFDCPRIMWLHLLCPEHSWHVFQWHARGRVNAKRDHHAEPGDSPTGFDERLVEHLTRQEGWLRLAEN